MGAKPVDAREQQSYAKVSSSPDTAVKAVVYNAEVIWSPDTNNAVVYVYTLLTAVCLVGHKTKKHGTTRNSSTE